jgi:hypothetical protein
MLPAVDRVRGHVRACARMCIREVPAVVGLLAEISSLMCLAVLSAQP